jgi:hypothetical protein
MALLLDGTDTKVSFQAAYRGLKAPSRSAYSRPGGAAPLCYPRDATPAMIES